MKIKYVLIVVGVVLIVLSAKMYNDGEASRTWALSKAKVLSSYVERTAVNMDHSSSSYTPVIEYEYSSNGKKYTGHNIKFGEVSFSKKSQAKSIIDEFPVNMEIEIYYNPNNPNESVIQPGVNTTKVGMLLSVGLLFLVAGLYFEKILVSALNSLKPIQAH